MNTDRTYGVEIEVASAVSKEELKCMLTDAFDAEGLDHTARVAGYHHNTDGANTKVWEVQHDVSIKVDWDYPTKAEIVSPVLKGREGLRAIETVCAAIQGKVRVDKSCGLHVHHYIEDAEKMNAVAARWLDMEETVMQALPPSRRRNRYCCKVRKPGMSRARMIEIATRNRYHTLNLSSYSLRNTIEFRCHSGTAEAEKIQNWILATQGMVEATVEGRGLTGRTIEDVKNFIASANLQDRGGEVSRRASRSEIVNFVSGAIEAGTWTKNDIRDEGERRGFKRSTIRSRLTEELKTRAEVAADGTIRFRNTVSRDEDYTAAAEWLEARHVHFRAAA